jgi:hypothetical protein
MEESLDHPLSYLSYRFHRPRNFNNVRRTLCHFDNCAMA